MFRVRRGELRQSTLSKEVGQMRLAAGGSEPGPRDAAGGVVKKALKPAAQRGLMKELKVTWSVSERRACDVLQFGRATHRSVHRRDRQEFLRMRIREMAATRVRYGYLRIHVLLKREGWKINRKRVYRIYTEEGLQMRRRLPRRHVSSRRQVERPLATGANEIWSMDFMSDGLGDGRKIRALTIVDNFTRESLSGEMSQRFSGHDVVRVLTRISASRGSPKSIRVDNVPEFISRALDQWAYLNQVELDFSRTGKPTDNALIESFNGRLREECLNQNWFMSLDDARRIVEEWRTAYDEERLHGSLG